MKPRDRARGGYHTTLPCRLITRIIKNVSSAGLPLAHVSVMFSSTEIAQFITEASEAIETDPQMNEAMTKKAVLDQFCELLNWQFPHPGQVEYPVEAFGQQYWVDYAYAPDGSEKAFLEVKGVDTPLTDDARSQLKAYLKNGTARLGILSNGQRYEFYRRVTSPELEVKQATALRLEELPDHPRILQEFTDEELSGGGDDDDVIDIIRENELRETLRTDKAEIAADIEQTIADHTEQHISGDELRTSIQAKIETAAKSTVDDLASRLESRPTEQAEDGEGGEDGLSEPDSYALRIVDPADKAELFQTTTEYQSDLMTAVVEYLIQHESLIDRIEPLPYVPGKKTRDHQY